jgi:TRAP-type C4-dicarboxylate transport system permease small subunit
MISVIRRISALHDRIIHLLASLSGILLMLMTLSVTVDVITRKIWGASVIGLVECNEHALVFMTFFSAALVLKQKGLVKVDLVLGWLGARAKASLNLATSCLGGVVCLFLAFWGALTVWDLWQRDVDTVKSLEIPMSPLFLPICIGLFLLSLQFFKDACKHSKALKNSGS